MNKRRERQNTLGLVSVITAALLILVLYFALAITGFEKSKGAEHAPKAQRLTRPQVCEHLRVIPDPDTWDEATDSYPRNVAWEECMGVGNK